MDAYYTVTPGVGKQHCLWRYEDPTRAVPAVNLHPFRIYMEEDLIPRLHVQVLAIAQVRDPAIIALTRRRRSRERGHEHEQTHDRQRQIHQLQSRTRVFLVLNCAS
jgi:hypothetical protein